jgi:hypothetical protein
MLAFGSRSLVFGGAAVAFAVVGSSACSGPASSGLTANAAHTPVHVNSVTIPFPGAGSAGQNQTLSAGFTPNSCGVAGPVASFDGGAVQITGPEHLDCYYASAIPGTPAAFLERVVETAEDQSLIHVRLTMNPAFVDNTYGDTAIGWEGSDASAAPPAGPMPQGPMMGGAAPPPNGPAGPGMHGHTFNDLVESDHAEFDMTDATGAAVLSFDLDYITAATGALSGYATLGVAGGDGKMLTGDASAIVYASTSLDRDLNACGYSSYTTDSPATDANYTPNVATPNWDYRVVYDVWVKASAFPAGFGNATIPYVHASPSKLAATLTVTPGPCPSSWDGCPSEGCSDAGVCVGEGCPGSDACEGEACPEDASTTPTMIYR